jgi:hypothetical protein
MMKQLDEGIWKRFRELPDSFGAKHPDAILAVVCSAMFLDRKHVIASLRPTEITANASLLTR